MPLAPPDILTPNSASQPHCVLLFVSVSRRLVCIPHFFNLWCMWGYVHTCSTSFWGYMVLSDHFQVYTYILLCLVLVGDPLLLGFCGQSIQATPTFLLVLLLLWVGACLCYLYNPGSRSLFYPLILLSALCKLIGADDPRSSYCIGATGVTPGVIVILR